MAFKSLHISKSLATNVLQNQGFQSQHNAPYLPTPHKDMGYKQKRESVLSITSMEDTEKKNKRTMEGEKTARTSTRN